MQTAEIKELQKRGNEAVKQLRITKHKKGLPFMINSKSLPGNQCYLEYPDGRILLVVLNSPSDRDFTTIRELSVIESEDIRSNYIVL